MRRVPGGCGRGCGSCLIATAFFCQPVHFVVLRLELDCGGGGATQLDRRRQRRRLTDVLDLARGRRLSCCGQVGAGFRQDLPVDGDWLAAGALEVERLAEFLQQDMVSAAM